MQVFWEKGYEATSTQDLVQATGLLKGSLYGAFGDKRSMYLAALEYYDQTRFQSGIDMLLGPGSVEQRIYQLFDSVIQSVKTGVYAGGCLLCNASVEMAAVDKQVQQSVQRQIHRLHRAVKTAITGEVGSGQDEDVVAGFIVSSYFGARVLAKAGMPIPMIEGTRDLCLKTLSNVQSHNR